jgi:catechol 2,3-dioxygenase-like lactoylglutathione lyase family enzyme
MRLDHIAYRVKDREKTTKFLEDCLGYKYAGTWDIEFGDGSTTKFNMLAPPEARAAEAGMWTYHALMYSPSILDERVQDRNSAIKAEFHAPPEIAVSDGPIGSIVGDWVAETNGGMGGVHHIAYEVDDVGETMKEWNEKHGVEFYSNEPIVCEEDNLVQVFSKPSELTGVIYELIKRGKTNKGFCIKSVKALMESTKKK